MIEVEQLRKQYGDITAVKDVTFTAQPGEIFGLLGPNGAGKTTTIGCISSLLTPTAGHIRVMGHDVVRDGVAARRSIGVVPQEIALYDDLSARENLGYWGGAQGLRGALLRDRITEVLELTGLLDRAKEPIKRFSGGMKRRLNFACGIVHQPKVLLLDEPTVGVDPLSRRELWQIVLHLVADQGLTVLLSTAYLDEAERCDEVVLLHEGRLLAQGNPAELRASMRGRTYEITVQDIDKRALQASLAQAPGVLDSLIQGDHVRVVMEDTTPPDPASLLPDVSGIDITPVMPRFEDRFVDLLKVKSAHKEVSSPPPRSPSNFWPGTRRKVREGVETQLPDQTDRDYPHPSLPPTRGKEQGFIGSKGADNSIIEVNNLQCRFGNFYAVKNVTFSVQRGEVFGLLGANGAGKSTTFRMLCGLLPPSGGALRVAGADLRHAAAAARARIGYMSQKFSLYAQLGVEENLRFFSSAYGLSGKRRVSRINWALEEFELAAMAEFPSGDLSLGYKQRLALACALMHEPEILFLDEPTSGVDPLARREFWSRINTLAGQGVTIMVTTHFMEEAEYCDRLAIMAAGEILTMGTPSEIKAQARSGAMPEPTMEDAFVELIKAHEQQGAAA